MKEKDEKDMATKEELEKVTRFYVDWTQSQQRVQMAQQSLQGATAEAVAMEGRFKGALEFIAGTTDVTWKYDPKDGVTFELNHQNGAPKNKAEAVVDAARRRAERRGK